MLSDTEKHGSKLIQLDLKMFLPVTAEGHLWPDSICDAAFNQNKIPDLTLCTLLSESQGTSAYAEVNTIEVCMMGCVCVWAAACVKSSPIQSGGNAG